MDKAYVGVRHDGLAAVTVEVEGKTSALAARLDLRNHSPTGFEWGYGGSGPAQLALAILADALGDDELAEEIYQTFKSRVVAELPAEGWRLTLEQVQSEVNKIRARVFTIIPADPAEPLRAETAVPDLPVLQRLVGGPIERVPEFTVYEGRPCEAWVDEEGSPEFRTDAVLNARATKLWRDQLGDGPFTYEPQLYGTVVIEQRPLTLPTPAKAAALAT